MASPPNKSGAAWHAWRDSVLDKADAERQAEALRRSRGWWVRVVPNRRKSRRHSESWRVEYALPS